MVEATEPRDAGRPAGHDDRKTIFVVGLGMVGIAFIEKLLNLDEETKRWRIVTCGEEPHFAYNRVGLTEFFEHRNIEKLFLQPPSWYAQHEPDRFEFYLGEQVTHVDTEKHVVETDKGKKYHYDICVLATGSDAGLPPYCTPQQAQSLDGIFVYRGIGDLQKLINYSEKEHTNRAVVVGGGLLGLEAAKAVYDLNLPDVAIINRGAYPLSRQLDADAGEMVLRKIEAMGVRVATKVSVQKMLTKPGPNGRDAFCGFELSSGETLDSDMVVFAVGIQPRDDVARKSGIECFKKGGVVVKDDLSTSAPDVYAIGECASWRGNTYGLIAPGIEMADILSFNLTQTDTDAGSFKPRKMNDPDLSTKLKLMGVDVASFGDFFADQRMKEALEAHEVKLKSMKVSDGPGVKAGVQPDVEISTNEGSEEKTKSVTEKAVNGSSPTKNGVETPRRKHGPSRDEPIKCLTYRDPFSSTYKKYIFTADGKYLLGGMMIGDTSDFVKLVAIVKKKKALDVAPSQFIIGAKKEGEDDGGDLDDDTQICSCHNVLKGDIAKCCKDGASNIGDIKSKTKAGTGCGGCMPLVTNIFKAEMKKAGLSVSTDLCAHFKMTRQDLFQVIKVKQLKDQQTVMKEVGARPDAVGCEICKPAVASILASLYNEHIMEPKHHSLQDTNDRFLANIQRNGTFSVIPRVPAGEIKPEQLIAIGQVAKEYDLYTKITGGQRIDMFGAKKQDLPDIWEKLIDAGFESGHAYGKSLRTVKSCVGTSWCRFGIGDSVGLAVQLENRYKGLRSPHKIKGGVSGCVRECAEAQGKDFGLIATDKGWNIFLGGNGGANPRHATLFASDVPPSKAIRIVDRFLAFYIQMADKLQRTAPWVDSFEGGIAKLKSIILDDELGICEDLDRYMDNIVGLYHDEWKGAINDPKFRSQFKQFANTDETRQTVESIEERGQHRPADWAKEFGGNKVETSHINAKEDEWKWQSMLKLASLHPTDHSTTSAAIRYGDSQLAVFHVPGRGIFATQQMCPHKRAFVLEHGLVGDDADGNLFVSCPMHKRNFSLMSGECFNDEEYKILSFDARISEDGQDVEIKLPPPDALDAVIGTEKYMVRKATAEAYSRGSAGKLEIVGPEGHHGPQGEVKGDNGEALACGGKLTW